MMTSTSESTQNNDTKHNIYILLGINSRLFIKHESTFISILILTNRENNTHEKSILQNVRPVIITELKCINRKKKK